MHLTLVPSIYTDLLRNKLLELRLECTQLLWHVEHFMKTLKVL